MEIGENLSKMVRCARFFCFSPNYGSSGACPQKMSHFGLKLTIWWPKQSSVIEKVKPHRARILFLEIGENLSKMVRCARFFCFSPNYGSSGACPQKMSHFGLKLTIWWPKQSSVIEKVKPHRARILFVNDNFSNNHCSKHTPYTCKGHSNSSPACVYCIFDIWNCLGNINTNCKISLY